MSEDSFSTNTHSLKTYLQNINGKCIAIERFASLYNIGWKQILTGRNLLPETILWHNIKNSFINEKKEIFKQIENKKIKGKTGLFKTTIEKQSFTKYYQQQLQVKLPRHVIFPEHIRFVNTPPSALAVENLDSNLLSIFPSLEIINTKHITFPRLNTKQHNFLMKKGLVPCLITKNNKIKILHGGKNTMHNKYEIQRILEKEIILVKTDNNFRTNYQQYKNIFSKYCKQFSNNSHDIRDPLEGLIQWLPNTTLPTNDLYKLDPAIECVQSIIKEMNDPWYHLLSLMLTRLFHIDRASGLSAVAGEINSLYAVYQNGKKRKLENPPDYAWEKLIMLLAAFGGISLLSYEGKAKNTITCNGTKLTWETNLSLSSWGLNLEVRWHK